MHRAMYTLDDNDVIYTKLMKEEAKNDRQQHIHTHTHYKILACIRKLRSNDAKYSIALYSRDAALLLLAVHTS